MNGGRKRPPSVAGCCPGGGGPSGPVRRRLVFTRAVVTNVDDDTPQNPNQEGPWELPHGLHVRKCIINSDGEYTHYCVQARDLQDMVSLGDFVKTVPAANNLAPATLIRLRDPLQRLIDMVGLDAVKRSMFELVVYYLQRLNSLEGDLLHTAVFGAPGVGKTMLIGILAEVYAALGVIRSDGPVVHARRTDLIGGYLGQTAIKTNEVIKSAAGGILVIDEAYSLGQEEGGRDIYATECVNTLNQALTEQRASFVCIIAGYKESIEQNFFRINPGLERRFTQRFEIPNCDASSLARIFRAKVVAAGWILDGPTVGSDTFWTEHKKYFTFNGGDVETFFARVRMAHAVRVYSMPRRDKRRVTQADFDTGFSTFCAVENVKKRGEVDDGALAHMYL